MGQDCTNAGSRGARRFTAPSSADLTPTQVIPAVSPEDDEPLARPLNSGRTGMDDIFIVDLAAVRRRFGPNASGTR